MFPEQREIRLPDYDGVQPLHLYVTATMATLRHEYGEEWLIVARGATALALPDIAFALRAQHRRVIGYRIIDGVLPAPTPDWPDAQVTFELTDSTFESHANQARLRGWDVIRSDA